MKYYTFLLAFFLLTITTTSNAQNKLGYYEVMSLVSMHCGEFSSYLKKQNFQFEYNNASFLSFIKGNTSISKDCSSGEETKGLMIISNNLSIVENIKNSFIQNGFKYNGSDTNASGDISYEYRLNSNTIHFSDQIDENGMRYTQIMVFVFD